MRAEDKRPDAVVRHHGDSAVACTRARDRDELRRRVDEGYYLTPCMSWEVAKRIAERGDR